MSSSGVCKNSSVCLRSLFDGTVSLWFSGLCSSDVLISISSVHSKCDVS